MAEKKAVRLADESHGMPPTWPPLFAVSSSKNVFINGRGAIRVSDHWNKTKPGVPDSGPARPTWSTHQQFSEMHMTFQQASLGVSGEGKGPIITISGAPGVFVNKLKLMREYQDQLSNGDAAITASDNVFVGDQRSRLRWSEGTFPEKKATISCGNI